MTPICNDQLTRVRQPADKMRFTELEQTFRVGDKGDKNGMPYTIKGFGSIIKLDHEKKTVKKEKMISVWMMVKYKGKKAHKWDTLWIGFDHCFKEKLVFGGLHPNPVYTHLLPKGYAQPV
jgi:hypothetical protein